jgi:hypothetical protein
MAAGSLAAVAGLTVPASAVRAADLTPACPSTGCVGARVEDTNCGLEKYGVGAVNVVDQDATDPSIADLWYSPLCNTVWGEYIATSPGQLRYIQLWSEHEYGGRNVLSHQADFIGAGFHETTMASADGSVKFCVTSLADGDPDLIEAHKPWNNCSVWH